MSKSTLTLQINSLPALERLIGGDTELELDIKHSIIEVFSKKYIKNLVTDTAIERVGKLVTKELDGQLIEEVRHSWSTSYRLTDSTKKIFEGEFESLLTKRIVELIQELIKTKDINSQIEKLLEDQTDYIINKLSDSILEDKLNRLVEKRLKEKLGIS